MKTIQNKKIVFTKFFALIAVLVLTSCSKLSMDELSIDPNNPTSADLDLLLTSTQADIAGNYGRNWDRYAGVFVQTFAGNHATGVNADRYLLTSDNFGTSFTSRYTSGFKDAETIIAQGSDSGSWQHVAIAKIMTAAGLGLITDVYGDIPFSESFKGVQNAYPKYDTQEKIYNTIKTLLSEAILDINKPSSNAVGSSDIIFKGNLTKWAQIANLLLARYNNHLSKISPKQSALDALKYVDAALKLGANKSSNLTFNYDGSANWRNPWYTLYENNLIIASKKFMDLLMNTNDPRLRAYWDDKPFNYPTSNGVLGFVGKPNGDPTGSASYSPVGPQTYYGKTNSPILIATFFELKFIEAEAAFRSGNKSRAATALNDAVKAQLDLVTPTVTNLITKEGGNIANYNSQITSYKNTYANETSSTISIEKIMTEKYKAMFTMNVETWTDLRRYDFAYPKNYLSLPNSANLAEYIRRGLYPQSELDNNSKNVPKDVKMTDRLWWDK